MATEPELRDRLQRLHEELERTKSVDPESRELLADIVNDIHDLLGEGESESSQESLVDRLGAATRRFEVTHPTLATTVGRVMDTLANLGI